VPLCFTDKYIATGAQRDVPLLLTIMIRMMIMMMIKMCDVL